MKLEPANDEEPAGGSRPVRRAGTPWPVELLVVFALIFVLDAALGPDTPLLGARPHVFWVPVLAMASVHGLVPGLLAALGASALSWWTLPRLSPALADHFAQWADYWHEPVLWFAAALLLGSYRDAQVRRRREAEARQPGRAPQRDRRGLCR